MDKNQTHNQNIVAPNLIGGLGNQLFIASAAYAVGKYHNSPVYLCDESENSHNIFKHDYRDTVLKGFGQKVAKPLAAMKGPGINIFSHPDFKPWNPQDLSPPVILYGYYQHITHIEIYEDEIRSIILDGLADHRAQLTDSCSAIDFTETAFIHVRRGDYVEKSDFHFLQPITYYQKAVAHIKSKAKKPIRTYLVFSDDPEWIEQNDFFKGLEGAIVVREPDEIACLALMSLCEGGAICANSTFSWWGAFLCKQPIPICVPERWIKANVIHLIPDGWTVL
jgi:hypothetical protein